MQQTLKHPVSFEGIGLHSGRKVRLKLRPAPVDTGIWFKRTDGLPKGLDPMIRAHWRCVTPTPLCTTLRNNAGVEVSTVEHLMAALAGCAIHNALIEIDGPEVPILDGSAMDFIRAFLKAEVVRQGGTLEVIEILETIELREGRALARLEPAKRFEIDFTIDFPDQAIGHQSKRLVLGNGHFIRELSDSRTFCRQAEVDAMRAKGRALGGSMENAVVVEGARVLNPGGLRRADEPVRHKMLDAMGDLALAGAPILGRYTGVRAGHAMTNLLLRKLFKDVEAWRQRPCDPSTLKTLPGMGAVPSDLPEGDAA